MNILFLSIDEINSIYEHGIYSDLLREFMNQGHEVYVLSALERRNNRETILVTEKKAHLLNVKVGNITKSNIIEKGISTVLIGTQYKLALKTYFADIKFDLVMYSTPPITLVGVVDYAKNKHGAKTYLLLKDIFPQNALDIGMLSKLGIKGIIYKFFRYKEKKLYAISDYIGCMSQANVDYVIQHNPEVNPANVEICPNCIEVIDKSVDEGTCMSIRKKYDIPLDKKVFVYGGNLGKPQGVDFLIRCLKSQKENEKTYFLIVGDGTEYTKLESFIRDNPQENVKLMKRLDKEDYDAMVGACDVGMIFLDHRFTIPNFPSRLLSYMQAKLPILACTDPNTDVGKVIVDGGFGWWCESDDVEEFKNIIDEIEFCDGSMMGEKGFYYLKNHYSVKESYQIITKHLEE